MDVDIIQDSEKAVLVGLGTLLAIIMLWVFTSFIGAFVVALFFYYSARPIHHRLQKRLNNSISAICSLLCLFVPVFVLLLYVLSIGVREFIYLFNNLKSNQFKEIISPYVNYQLLIDIQNSVASAQYGELLSNQGPSFISQTSGVIFDYFGLIGTFLIQSFIIVIVSYYLLKDGEQLVKKLIAKIEPSTTVKEFLIKVDSDFQTIFFGNLLNALLTSSIGIFSFLLLEMHFAPSESLTIGYPVLIGLLCGLGSLIPVIGMKIVYFPVTAYLLFKSVITADVSFSYPIFFFIVSAIIVDGIPDLVIRPYISSGDLHLGLIMLSYIIGPLLFGWYGLFLGPIIVVVLTHFCSLIIPYILNKNHTLSEFS